MLSPESKGARRRGYAWVDGWAGEAARRESVRAAAWKEQAAAAAGQGGELGRDGGKRGRGRGRSLQGWLKYYFCLHLAGTLKSLSGTFSFFPFSFFYFLETHVTLFIPATIFFARTLLS